MRKGSLLFNAFFAISVLVMAYFILEMGVRDEKTLISLGTLGAIAVVIFGAYVIGVNKLAHIKVSLKKVRKKILDAHVKDPEYVWEWLCKEKFLFKNSSLDGQFNNYKKEMSRLENEGAVYCQAEVNDYINKNNIYASVKKSLLDSVAIILALIGVIGVLVQICYDLRTYPFTASLFVKDTLVHIIVILICTFVLIIEYVFVYKISLSRVNNECSLFISEFQKYVVPKAKNDMVNNVLYLQQLQIETLTNTLNRFNEGVDELAYNIKEILESGKVTSSEGIKAMKDCLEKLENTIEKTVEKNNAVEEKEEKKTTRKKAATTKTTKTKTTATKTASKTKKVKEEDEVKTTKDKEEIAIVEENKVDSNDADKKETEVVVEVAPVKKKRGRKSKAEKEAELKAAIANAVKEAEEKPKKSTRGRKKKTEVEEVKTEEVIKETDNNKDEVVQEVVELKEEIVSTEIDLAEEVKVDSDTDKEVEDIVE